MFTKKFFGCCIGHVLNRNIRWPILCLMAGAALAYALAPMMYKNVGYEVKRIYYIHKNLHDSTQDRPEILVLGNSVVMNGIDCRRLSRGLDGNPVAWNLASTGQFVVESMMIFEDSPSSVKTVILGVITDAMITPPKNLSLNRAIPYKLCGFGISESIIQVLNENGLKENVRNLSTPYWTDVLETRSAILNSVNSYARKKIRRDLELDKSVVDMFYPSTYTNHVSKETLNMLADKLYKRRTADMGQVSPVNRNLYDALGEMASDRGCRFVLLVMPEPPLHKKWDHSDFYDNFDRAVEQLKEESNFEVWNYRNLLSQEYFVDHIHTDAQGAEILTKKIIKRMQNRME